MLEECEKKAVDLKVNLDPKRKIEALDDSDSDSDFVEVTSKDDYEAEVRADDTLLGIPFYPQATASSNIEISEPKPGTSGLQEKMSSSWKLEISAEAADPTTFAATLAKLKVRTDHRKFLLIQLVICTITFNIPCMPCRNRHRKRFLQVKGSLPHRATFRVSLSTWT